MGTWRMQKGAYQVFAARVGAAQPTGRSMRHPENDRGRQLRGAPLMEGIFPLQQRQRRRYPYISRSSVPCSNSCSAIATRRCLPTNGNEEDTKDGQQDVTYVYAKYAAYVFNVCRHKFLDSGLGERLVFYLICLADGTLRNFEVIAKGIHVHLFIGWI